MKTIGVLGGLGPQATMDFVSRVHSASRELIPAHANSGYPPMIVYYCRFPPVLLNNDGTPQQPVAPEPKLLDAAQTLGGVADFLVIPSNTPHLLQEHIEHASGRKVLSMIDITVSHILRKHYQRVGVLGFHEPTVYTRPLSGLGIACHTCDPSIATRLNAAIRNVMEGSADASDRAAARDAVQDLRAQAVEAIILGCTEIPLLLHVPETEDDLINPAQLLAQATVRHAL